eukprot:TRINITY_DN13358_c0_g1_i1.p1 TRINITY_DN13358_c0_g1~~TRINITY_DN13358_c0_g1_i1.p1  ORF type:complete len:144 (-),score=30.46 TRINITY_DN13358_c0_g1_i1:140-571(-)
MEPRRTRSYVNQMNVMRQLRMTPPKPALKEIRAKEEMTKFGQKLESLSKVVDTLILQSTERGKMLERMKEQQESLELIAHHLTFLSQAETMDEVRDDFVHTHVPPTTTKLNQNDFQPFLYPHSTGRSIIGVMLFVLFFLMLVW